MNSENRNTILLFVIVFAVSIIALIAVLAISWQIIGDTVKSNIESLGVATGRTNLDYRFEVPGAGDSRSLYKVGPYQYRYTQDLPTDITLNYNFEKPITLFSSNQFQIVDDILLDARSLGLGTDFSNNFSTDSSIEIPKIGLLSDIYSGKGTDEVLKRGFWETTESTTEGEKIFLCYRKFLSPNDARSCWYLDKLSKDDSIYITTNGNTKKYTVVSVEITDTSKDLYSTIDKDSIKIVTAAPLDKLDQRLVVEAVRADSQ